MGDMTNTYKILVRNPVGKRSHRKPRCKWREIRMDLRERRW